MSADVRLSVRTGGVTTAPASRALMEAITEVQVTGATSGRSGFDLRLAVSTRSPLITEMLPAGDLDPPTRVIISVVVAGVTTVLMDGVITRHEMVPTDVPGNSVLSIKGEDLTRMMDLVDLTGLPYPGMPATAQVLVALEKYAALYKIIPLVVPSVLDIPNPAVKIPAQVGTDLGHISALAERVGYVVYLQPGPVPGVSTLYWGPSLRAAIPFLPTPAPLAIDWDGRSNVESLQFAFDGFSATQWVVLVKMGAVAIPIPVPDVNPLSPPLASRHALPLKISPITGLGPYDTAQAVAIALGKAARTANVVTGSGSLDVLRYGAVLPARTVVEVRGAGATYDGSYYVDATTHTLKKGSYKQSFTLSRNGLVAHGSTGPGGAPGQALAAFPQPPASRVRRPEPR